MEKALLRGFLPLEYKLSRNRMVIQLIQGEADKPCDAFISETHQRLIKTGAKRELLVASKNSISASDVSLISNNIAGIILHVSRCGSTLLCNMLDTLDKCFVVRESPIINELLFDDRLSCSQKKHLLDHILFFYAYYAKMLGRRCVIKLTSYCVFQLPFIIEHFPSVPRLFLHRHPVKVLGSIVKAPPGWVTTDVLVGKVEINELLNNKEIVVRAAAILSQLLTEALAQQKYLVVMSYDDLLKGIGLSVAELFKFEVNETNSARMGKCLTYNAKTKKPFYLPDGLTDQTILGIQKAYQTYCKQIYERL